LEELSNEEVLRESISSAVARGNLRAAEYPLDLYQFNDVRTINWHKNVISETAYKLLVLIIGKKNVDKFPRPYVSEEPALMVVVLSTGTSSILLLLILGLRRIDKAAPLGHDATARVAGN
jgi:hypothetical protein